MSFKKNGSEAINKRTITRKRKGKGKIHYKNIYHITQLTTIHVTSPLYYLKLIFQSPITLHMNHTLNSKPNNNKKSQIQKHIADKKLDNKSDP